MHWRWCRGGAGGGAGCCREVCLDKCKGLAGGCAGIGARDLQGAQRKERRGGAGGALLEAVFLGRRNRGGE